MAHIAPPVVLSRIRVHAGSSVNVDGRIITRRIAVIHIAGATHMAKQISSRAAKAKGRKFQQQIAKDISELVNIPHGKDELIESREMGQAGVDIKLIGRAREVFPWSVEAKNDKSFQLKSWIRQAATNMMDNTNWIVFFKKNHFKPVAVFDSELFDNLFEEHDLGILTYSSSNWFLEKWVTQARNQSGDLWQIRLDYLDRKIVMLEMTKFFHMLKVLECETKGLCESHW